MLKEGDIVRVQSEDSSATCYSATYSIGIVESIVNNDSLYYGEPSYCHPASERPSCNYDYYFVKVKILTTKEARALFVCAE